MMSQKISFLRSKTAEIAAVNNCFIKSKVKNRTFEETIQPPLIITTFVTTLIFLLFKANLTQPKKKKKNDNENEL